jgi:RNA polymerase sigma-70 factor (ECF subfamily)
VSAADNGFDPQFLDRVRTRDPDALERFFETFFDRVYGYVSRLVRDRHEAEDLTQLAFLKMHRAIHTLDPGRNPTPWVFAVAANTVRDHWRSKPYKQSAVNRPLDGTPLADNLTAEDDQEAREAAEILEGALERLSENLRAVVLLRDYAGVSYAEVSRILGIEEPAARKRHSRALDELRTALREGRVPAKRSR